MKKSPGIILISVILAAVICGSNGYGKKTPERTAKTVRQEKSKTQKELDNARRDLNRTTTQTKKKINALRSIEAEIVTSRLIVDTINTELDSINALLKNTEDSIELTRQRLSLQKEKYGEELRRSRSMRQTLNPALYVFGGSDFSSIWRRMRFIGELASWRVSQAAKLKSGVDSLTVQQARYEEVMRQRTDKLNELLQAQTLLDARKRETAGLIAELKTRGDDLNRIIKQKREQMKSLDRELDRIIAEEARNAKEAEERRARQEAERRAKAVKTPAGDKSKDNKTGAGVSATPRTSTGNSYDAVAEESRRLTGGFTQNKGNILFPVAGRYKIVSAFGLNKHSDLKNIDVNNNGIDIEVTPGTNARAVFDGDVTAIFRIGGYDNVVMLRHGSYLTVYAGLSQIAVRKGQKIRAGEPLGRISSDSEDNNRTVLHFEIRNEREKLNPLDWVR